MTKDTARQDDPDEASGTLESSGVADVTQPLTDSDALDDAPDSTAEVEEEQFMPGKKLGGVELVRKLAEGGMGGVWLAEHAILGKQVAVKIVSTRLLRRKPSVAKRIEREAEALAKLDHEHIVRIYDFGTTELGTPYLVMELLHGMTLARLMKKMKRLELPLVVELVDQIAAALSAAHALGIVHRDIKPGNIFVCAKGADDDEDFRVKVLDFGIAKQVGLTSHITSVTATGVMLGTPHFMSPEQLLEPKTVDYHTDLWSLGVVAFSALTGKLPFKGETLAQLFQAITSGTIKKPSDVVKDTSAEVDAWFAKALNRDPRQRFDSAKDMAEQLQQVADAVSGAKPAPKKRKPDTPEAVAAMEQARKRAAAEKAASAISPDTLISGEEPPPKVEPRTSRPPEKMLPYPFALLDGKGGRRSAPRTGGPDAERDNGGFSLMDLSRTQQLAAVLLVLLVIGGGLYLSRSGASSSPAIADDSVRVPRGVFEMGCNDATCGSDERPAHQVMLEAYDIDRTEVSVARYRACVESGPCTTSAVDQSSACTWGRAAADQLPMNCVTWEEADRFCDWSGKRLPTEAEWEHASRGEDGRVYPWGSDAPTCSRAVLNEAAESCNVGAPLQVASRPSVGGPYGALDLAGNVAEWVADWYAGDYYTRSPREVPTGPDEGDERVVRGGSWFNGNAETVRAAARDHRPPSAAGADIGFRCARDAP